MRKKILSIFLFIVLSLSSFGTGMLTAEMKIRKAKASQNHSSSPILIKNENAAVESENEVLKEKEVAAEAGNGTVLDPVNADQSENNEEKFSFAVIGDTQRFESNNPNGGIQRAVNNIQKQNVDFVMSVGDLVSSCDGKSGCEKKLNEWKGIIGSASPRYYPTEGNHDRTGGGAADELWQKVFDLPTNGPPGYSELVYSFDYKNSHFVALDSDKPEEHVINKEQRDWLEKDLSDYEKSLPAGGQENIFVFFHEPAYPVSHKISDSLDAEKGERDALWNILAKHNVTAVFNGHEHIHSRRQVAGVYQFVFGNTDSYDHELPKAGVAEYAYQGENYGIVEINGKEVTVKVFKVDGNLLNTFTFSK